MGRMIAGLAETTNPGIFRGLCSRRGLSAAGGLGGWRGLFAAPVRQGVPVALAFGVVVHAFPTGDDQYGQSVADHVECGARHVHHTVDTGDERQAFQRNAHAAQGSQQDDEGHTRHTGDTFGGHHQGQHQHQLLADRQVNAVQLGDKDRRDALIQGRTVEVERVAGRYHKAADGLRRAVSFHLLDDARQHGFGTGGGVGQYQLILEDEYQRDHREAEQASDQAQHHEGEEQNGDVNQNHQLGQRQQRGEAEVGDGHRDQGKYADRGVLHDHVGDFEHALGDALEHCDQRLAQFRLEARQAEAEQHREEDDRQHVATGDGGEDIRRNQVEDGLDERMLMLHFGSGGGVLGDIDGTQGTHVDASAWVEQVGQQQTDHDGDGGDHFEVKDGFDADATELLRVTHAGDANDQ